FGNRRKLDAICDIAQTVTVIAFNGLKERVLNDPIGTLQQLPFIGPVTVFHLAKNLGFDVAKNDRHLARLAATFGFDTAHDLCRQLSQRFGDPVSVVDLILWRYCVSYWPRRESWSHHDQEHLCAASR